MPTIFVCAFFNLTLTTNLHVLQNFVYLTLSVFCIFMLSAYLLQPSQSNYFIADEDTSSKEALSNEDETEIKDVELLNDVNGSFVSDKD